MIKIAVFFAVVAAAHAATLVAPGLWNSGILVPSAVSTSSVVGIPGAITTERRVIGTTGLWGGSPLLLSNGIIGNGIIGASPLSLSSGIISPLGIPNAGIIASPGVVKTILK
ncbi:uncharacterized protein LOC118189428 [Stegodyphus dumicola]|uniref:uncharacterized protein LOC118189428 n=1 Tax=Stegodyphus dumicola TaxID=202533 RepID=UPI0015B2512D|nr:uncharacterized protein LOC118189428 [Stegodyphus dumicola]